MELQKSPVHRGLDVKMKVGGLEALDLIFVLILAGGMNMLGIPSLIVLSVTVSALCTLYLGKRGKPEGYLLHLLRYLTTPGNYSAGNMLNLQIGKGRITDGKK